MGALGDVARGLALVAHIKAHLPNSRLTWLVEPKSAGLVGFHPQIDQMIVFNRAWRFAAVWELHKRLRQEHFDIALDLQRHLKSGCFSLLSGAKRRVGFHRRDAKEMNWLFNNEHIGYFGNELPKLFHYLKFTEYLGLPDPACLDFGLSALDALNTAPRAAAELREPYIAIVLGSAWESKNWLLEGYEELARQVLTTGKLKIVLLGDRSHSATAARLSTKIALPGLINLVGQTSLLELSAVLKAAAAGVGPDSGPGHLAAAVGTPYVSLFGPTSPERTAPYGCENLVVQAQVDCAPCYRKQCPGLARQCMRAIGAEAVMAKLSQALARQGLNCL
ncbi:MAG: glycosyltransferase family 9 protein [Desulfobacterales bacterium]|nr:MAG: glycosyltransferase family 9 protein [Desulfobacterales bacterium]